MLTKSGVKLLDFGLAKLAATPTAAGSVTSLPTEQDLTQEGAILGTFQYMAPEQLEGKEADARTDIFAFGAVLYEMATGRKAFSGTTQASLIGAILHTEPTPISSLQPMTPPALERVVRTCLSKDTEERWQSAADVKRELRWVAEGSQAGMTVPPVTRPRSRERLVWVIAMAALLLAGAALLRPRPRPATFAGPMRSSLILSDKSAIRAVALSPDGTRLAFVGRDSSGRTLLWIRDLASLSEQPLPGTENPSFPFWSPDGRFIGFFAEGKLRKIAATGGPPESLCDAAIGRGATWSREGVILFAPVPDNPLFRVSASGGVPVQVTRLDPTRLETSHRWPVFLPDGRHFLYTVASFGSVGQKERMGVYVGSLDSKEEKFLLRANSSLAYSPEGFLLFTRERNLMAQPFDAKGLRIVGDPLPIAEQVQYFPQNYSALFSVSENGLLVYQTRSGSGVSQLLWVDRNGKPIGTLGVAGDQANPRISRDGKRIALDMVDPQTGNNDIWVYEASGGLPSRLTNDPAFDNQPIWSPDGKRIVFASLRAGRPDLYQRSSSGAGADETILLSERSKYPTDWSPDGKFILYRVFDARANFELWTLPLEGDRKPVPFLKTAFGVSHGQFSPDGRWVAYASNESGKWEIAVAPFPGPGGSWKVSSAGGSEPRWRGDGKELYYIAPDGKLMAVDVKADTVFEAGVAKPLFQTRRREHISSGDLFSYDVAADGQRFLVNTDVGEVASPPLTVMLDWAAGLKK